MTAKIHALPASVAPNVPAKLRALADDIETGRYGDVLEAAVVINGAGIVVFGLGMDAGSAHLLFGSAMHKLQAAVLEQEP